MCEHEDTFPRLRLVAFNICFFFAPASYSDDQYYLLLFETAHVVTYGLIPVENRLLWVDAVEIIWVTILATQAAALADDDKAGDEDDEVAAVVDGDKKLAVETR